jgi:tellurite resistance protein TerC
MEMFFIILQVIILDGILSIDNAAALAALANQLPEKKESPLPTWTHPFLGVNQREVALKVGILGAYLGRGLMLLLAGLILQFPILQLAGAAYLLYLVGTHFFNWSKWEPEFKGVNTFWKTVVLIELADLAFSLDNVAAVVALSPNIWIIILGVFISIVIMRFAAGIFMKLIKFEPLLEHAAFVLIAAIGIELILKFFHFEIGEVLQFGISMAILAGFITYGQIGRRLGIVEAKE